MLQLSNDPSPGQSIETMAARALDAAADRLDEKQVLRIADQNISNTETRNLAVTRKSRVPRYLELPYIVKGMDVSFSGLLTYIEMEARKKIETGSISVAVLTSMIEYATFHAQRYH